MSKIKNIIVRCNEIIKNGEDVLESQESNNTQAALFRGSV